MHNDFCFSHAKLALLLCLEITAKDQMIQVTDIHKRFGSLEVLKGVSLHVDKGEIVAIVGKSGAGKTTLLQVMGTLLRPDSGTVTLDGTEVNRLNDKSLAQFRNRHIGFIFQQHQLLPEFTAQENVMMPALIGGLSQAEASRRAEELLARFHLTDRLQHKPNQLSGGEQQRVAAARALMMSPSVILADEPTGSLDQANKQDMHNLLLDMRRSFGQTIVIVTHDKDLAAIADRTLTMQDGLLLNDHA